MRKLFRRLGAFYEKHALAIDLALITAGAAACKRQLEGLHGRLERLENGGLVPLDDVVTLRDLEKFEGALRLHHAVLGDAGLLPEQPQPEVEPEGVPEAPQGAEAPTAVHVAGGPQEGEEAH